MTKKILSDEEKDLKILKEKEKMKIYNKKYYDTNKDIILNTYNKEILCECGSHYKLYHKSRHFKSNKHIKNTTKCPEFINELLNVLNENPTRNKHCIVTIKNYESD